MRGLFVTATDTDAGKTTVTAALAVLLAECTGGRTLAVKPVQTGCCRLGDGSLLAPDVDMIHAAGGRAVGLHLYEPPCSPHLAAELAGERLEVAELVRRVRAAVPEGWTALVEGAGGCAVPVNDHETMMDLMLALGLPVLLVVANRLGCISHALLSIEALQARGLRVAGMVLDRVRPVSDCDAGCGPWAGVADENRILTDNERTLALWGERLGVPLLASLPHAGLAPGAEGSDRGHRTLPGIVEALRPAALRLHVLLDGLARKAESAHGAGRGDESAESCARTARDLAFDRDHLWHPYTSATDPLPVHMVAATHGNRIVLADGRELVDGMSSWWCAIHGYGNPALEAAMARQLHTMSHVMFGGLTHAPAVELGRRLLALAPEGLGRIFYADSGSVAVEVALKMAVQYQVSLGRGSRRRFLTPMGGYHGDTQGAMSVCDPVNGMHTLFAGLFPRHLFISRPSCRFDAPFDPASLDEARQAVAEHRDEIAAVILEPVVQGAGGMWFYHPDYLAGMRRLCDEEDILLVCDEIATGFGRTGKLFASQWAGVVPDIMCVGKALTGGMMTGAAVLAGEKVAQGLGRASAEQGGGVLMHGPTFMGNPLFCAAACASLDFLAASPWQARVAAIEKGLGRGLAPCRGRPGVRDVRVLGAIGVVEVERPVNMAALQDYFVGRGVWIRPFNRLVYLMPPYVTPEEDVATLCAAVCGAVEEGLA